MTTEALVAVPVGDPSLLARRRAAQRPYYEHPSCAADEAQAHAADEEQAHATANAIRVELYNAAADAARRGALADSARLAEAAADVLDSHYRQRASA